MLIFCGRGVLAFSKVIEPGWVRSSRRSPGYAVPLSNKEWSRPGTFAEDGMLRTYFDELIGCPLKVWAVKVAVV